MKIGLLFAGQGAQYSGMGKSLFDNSQRAKTIFDVAGSEIQNWCFEGTKEELKQTNVTQPCIYTVSIAAYEAFLEALEKMEPSVSKNVQIQGVAGFSLGEYSALTAAGVISDFQEGIEIVKKRGAWMNQAGKNKSGENIGGMVAALGERKAILECVDQSRENGILEGVNFNSPVQTVVAGDKAALERFTANAKGACGIKKAIPLSVSTAFHSPMMEPAVLKLQELLLSSKLQNPTKVVYCNVTGKDLMADCAEQESTWIANLMAKQAKSPVYWQETIENMAADGIDTFIEFGPGTTLCGMVKKIAPNATTMHVEDMETLGHTMETLLDLLS